MNSIGEQADKMAMDEIINHPQFVSLEVLKRIGTGPDYWEVTFDNGEMLPNGNYQTIFNQEVQCKLSRFFKKK